MSGMKLLSIIVVSFLLGGAATFYSMDYLSKSNPVAKTSDSDIISTENGDKNTDAAYGVAQVSTNAAVTSPAVDREEQIVQGIYEKVSPAVVHITTVRYMYNFWRGDLVPQKGTGSGVVVDAKGYILTNFHVIKNSLSSHGELYVTFANGESEEASVVGFDEISDLAVIKLTNDPDESLPIAPLGDSDFLKVGSRAIAIGNPFGLSGTCTVGFISALNRTISVGNDELEGMIQTDATINPGNSGGPLINSNGDVIGINSVIFSQSGGSEGIGFAIPINAAKKVMRDLIAYGKVRRPYLGIETFPVLSTLSAYLKLPVTEGLLVQRVAVGSPAAKAGLQGGTTEVAFRQFRIFTGGDIILSLNGEKMTNPMEFEKRIRKMGIGEKITLEVMRGTRKINIDVQLESKD